MALKKFVDQDKDVLSEDKRKKKGENQHKLCKGYYPTPPHQKIDTQSNWEQWLSSQRSLPLVFMAEYDDIWNEISLWSIEDSCHSCASSQLSVLPHRVWWQGSDKQKALILCKHCLAIAKK